MTISVLNLGMELKHQYIDNVYLSTNLALSAYDFVVIDPIDIKRFVPDNIPISEVKNLFEWTRSATFNYISNGGIVICFLRPISSLGGISNYDWVFKSKTPGESVA